MSELPNCKKIETNQTSSKRNVWPMKTELTTSSKRWKRGLIDFLWFVKLSINILIYSAKSRLPSALQVLQPELFAWQ